MILYTSASYRAGERTRALDPETSSLIEELVDKYMDMLKVPGKPPQIVIRDNLGSKWLGLNRWTSDKPKQTTIELQRSILSDEKTLERVIAHEMVHHFLHVTLSDVDIEMYRRYRRGPMAEHHGEDFLNYAGLINDKMGAGFVTVKSDQDFKLAENEKEFYLLVFPVKTNKGTELGWTWAAHLGPKAKRWLDTYYVKKEAKLVLSTDVIWIAHGSKIGSRHVSLPYGSAAGEMAARLEKIYYEGESVDF